MGSRFQLLGIWFQVLDSWVMGLNNWVLEFWVLAIGFCKILGFGVLSYGFEQLSSTCFWILGFRSKIMGESETNCS